MFLLFDVGGTKLRVAASEDLQTFREPVIRDTPANFDAGVEALVEAAHALHAGDWRHVVGGVPGPLNAEKSALTRAPHLPAWAGAPLKERLQKALHAPVFLENDAALVGLGEAHFGAGRGAHTLAYLTISTGVGGTRVIGGKIDGAYNYEPGHQIIDLDATACPSCKSAHGTLEEYVSGSAIERRFGKHPTEVKEPELWGELARFCAVGVANTILYWRPDVVVLGGSMIIGEPNISVDAISENVPPLIPVIRDVPPIKKAELGALGGLYGGLAYLRAATVE